MPWDIVFVNYGVSPTEADYVFRTGRPARALADMGYRVRVLELFSKDWPGAALDARLVFLTMNWQGRAFDLLEKRQARGLPSVYQLDDDYFHLPKSSIVHQLFGKNPLFQDMLVAIFRKADLVQFSSHGLAKRYGPLCKAKFLAKNAVDPLPLEPFQSQAQPTIGLVFSQTHGQDLEAALPCLEQIHRLDPSINIEILCGDGLAKTFGHLPWINHLKSVPYEGFLDVLRRWDLLVVPQVDHPFNEGRSDSKWLDAARVGLPALLPKALPYSPTVVFGETAFGYDRLEDIPDLVTTILGNPLDRQKVREAAWKEVTTNRTWEAEMKHRAQFFQEAFGVHPSGQGELHDTLLPEEKELKGRWDDFQDALGNQPDQQSRFQHPDIQKRLKWFQDLLAGNPDWLGLYENLLMVALPQGEEADLPQEAWPDWDFAWPRFLYQNEQLTPPPELQSWPTAHGLAAFRAATTGKTYEANKGVKAALAINAYSPLALKVGINLALAAGSLTRAEKYWDALATLDPEEATALKERLWP